MPFYKTTKNIFVDFDEHFDANWMDTDEVFIPANDKWDYSRELTINDVDLWETIWEGELGIYAAYQPFAEFYMAKFPLDWLSENPTSLPYVTFYGPNAQTEIFKLAQQWGIKLPLNQLWVEDNEMWLYK
mgnify:CR=1 FL=1|jgi:hypothetical protein